MVYCYDGSKNGFFTAFLSAFGDESALLCSTIDLQLPLGEILSVVETDEQKARKVKNRLKALDSACLTEVDLLLRCGDKNAVQIAFLYLRYLAKSGGQVRGQLSVPDVFHADALLKKVRLEIHRLHGFIRFKETENGILYAPFSPDNDICDLLLPHFRARLGKIPFVLHDIKRKKACFYDGDKAFIAPLDKAEVLLAQKEEDVQSLFKKYYKAVNIPSRERLKQMRGYMPTRYQKFMPETQATTIVEEN